MSVQWETIKSEKDLILSDKVKIDVEKVGSDIRSLTIRVDGKTLRVSKPSSYSDTLEVLVPAEKSRKVETFTVVAKKDNDQLESVQATQQEADDRKYDLEREGWECEIVLTELSVTKDIISNKEDDIPF